MCHIFYHLIDMIWFLSYFCQKNKKIFFKIKRKSEFALVNFYENIYIVFSYFFHKFKLWMTLSTSFGSDKVHSFLKLCFAWYSIETIWWYLQNCSGYKWCAVIFCKWVYEDSSNRSLAALCNPLTGCRLGGVNITIIASILQIYSAKW